MKNIGKTAQDVGETIVIRRKALGLNQEQLADKVGVLQTMISRWERGVTPLPGPMAKVLAKVLDVPVVDLLVTAFPSTRRSQSQPDAPGVTLEEFLKSVPVVGSVSAGRRLDMMPSQVQENLFDVIGSLPSGIMAVRVSGNSMSFVGEASISDGDFAIVDPSRTDPYELVGRVVCARYDGEEHLIKELYRQRDRFFLRSWNPTFPPIEITSGEARIEGLVLFIIRRM